MVVGFRWDRGDEIVVVAGVRRPSVSDYPLFRGPPARLGAPMTSPATDEPGLSRALTALRSLLIPGEELQTHAIQRRMFALTHRRTIVGATSGRLIVVTRGLFGDYTPQDVRWQDLQDAQLRVGVFGATLSASVHGTADLATAEGPRRVIRVDGLRKGEAQEVYRACQSQEQAWREKRRVRELEELRAKSGGINLAGGMGAGGPAPPTTARRRRPAGCSAPRTCASRASSPTRSSSRSRRGFSPTVAADQLAELVETSRPWPPPAEPARQDRPARGAAGPAPAGRDRARHRRTSAGSCLRRSSASAGRRSRPSRKRPQCPRGAGGAGAGRAGRRGRGARPGGVHGRQGFRRGQAAHAERAVRPAR